MRKNFLLLFFNLFVTGLFCQGSYKPFPGFMINYSHLQNFTQSDPAPIGQISYNRYEINGDTIINGKHYSILYTGLGPYSINGFLRNDTLNKLVYKYYPVLGYEKVLYDFNLNVGDTINKNSDYNFFPDLLSADGITQTFLDTVWVESIDSILMPHDLLYHRRFNLAAKYQTILFCDPIDFPGAAPHCTIKSSKWGPYYACGDSISGYNTFYIQLEPLIEGVGQLKTEISHYQQFEGESITTVRCASINGISIVNYSYNPPYPGLSAAQCNSILTGIDEDLKQTRFSFYPNPFSESISIESFDVEQELLVELIDVTGKVVLSEYIKSNYFTFKTIGIDSGIYILRIVSSDGYNLVNKKVIKY